MSDTALILLAAGASTRMGSPKQLLRLNGRPMLRIAAETAIASGCSPVVVVLGANAGQVQSALDGLPVDIHLNPHWQQGMGSSIHTGLRAVASAPASGIILALADQPFVTADHLTTLCRIHRESGKPIVAARYAGTLGVPAYFARSFFPLLAALEPGQGCKPLINAHLHDCASIDCEPAALDIDTPGDFAATLAAHGA